MVKVMISLPEELLQRLDGQAASEGETRSGLLRNLVEAELERTSVARRASIERLLSQARPMGGDSVTRVRADRARR